MAKDLQRLGSQAHRHQALHTQNQRQGRALWPTADCIYIKTLLGEWAYAMPFQTSEERNRWLPRYLGLHNDRRRHMALGGLSPQQCLQRMLVAE